jgi:Calcineurin-like phosphoesterase
MVQTLDRLQTSDMLSKPRRKNLRVVQISDTHLTDAGGITAANLQSVAAFVNETLRPDLIVHTGDVVGLLPDSPADRLFARKAHEAFDAPIRFLSGNHDVGEPGENPWMGLGVNSDRVRAHRDVFGNDYFAERFADWTIVGLGSQLLGSGLPEEQEQWEWLAQTLQEARSASILLFLHKALWRATHVVAAEIAMSVPESARERLFALADGRIRAVGSGHLHNYWRHERPELLELWAPSTAFIAPVPSLEAHFKQLGVVEWRLEPTSVDSRFRAPADLQEMAYEEIPEIAALIEQARYRHADSFATT